MSLEVTVLAFEGCPSWRTALERVYAAAEQAGVQVRLTTRTVQTDEDADLLGFTGSPTILIGGRDGPVLPAGDGPGAGVPGVPHPGRPGRFAHGRPTRPCAEGAR